MRKRNETKTEDFNMLEYLNNCKYSTQILLIFFLQITESLTNSERRRAQDRKRSTKNIYAYIHSPQSQTIMW